ncbi:MAG: hypothetical protein NC078_01705 [Ruminococcus sp.]|nr:hypothetical protein [Ruminococcus sp.]
MKRNSEKIWQQYKRATRLQYICTLLTLHRAFGFGSKRLDDFEQAFSDVVTQINEYCMDEVINEKLGAEMKEMGYDLESLLKDKTELTFSEMQRQEKVKKKQSIAECAEAARRLREAGLYSGGKF